MAPHTLIAYEQDIEEASLSTKDLLNLRVLAKNGQVVGYIKELKLHPTTFKILGAVVRGRDEVYIGKTYFDKLTTESLILNIDPTIFLVGKKVITHDGKFLGRVVEIKRKGNTNDLRGMIISSFLKKKMTIPPSAVKFTNGSIILGKQYNGIPKYFWQKD